MSGQSHPSIHLLAAAFVAVTAQHAAGATSPDGRIAYTACAYDSDLGRQTCDIWLTGPGGDDPAPKNLTKSPEVDEGDPTWSPDGSRIAFTRDLGSCNNNIFVMNADGSREIQVTNRDLPDTTGCQVDPTWGPGGVEIAFLRTSPVDGSAELAVVEVETGAERVISPAGDPGGSFNAIELAWSPDGSKFAYSAVREEVMENPITGEPEPGGAQYEIVLIEADGSGERVVSAGLPGSRRAVTLEEDRAPAWSPDGSRLVFMSQSQDPSCCTPWQVWVVNADGTGIENVSADPGIDDTHPSWSPDGNRILFSRWEAGGKDLYVMDAPAPEPAPLAGAGLEVRGAVGPQRVTSVGDAEDPSWGPRASRGPSSVKLVVKSGGRGTGMVTTSPGDVACSSTATCSATFARDTSVVLTATPSGGSAFARWTGKACRFVAGPQCTVVMNRAQRVKALFTAP